MFALKLVFCFVITTAAAEIDVGLPLTLTPYIKSGDIEEARKLALVTELELNITSYAGFFTVDEECDSNMFFWYFPAQFGPEKNPVTLWLQGGPGSSSLFGLFIEHGPYELTMDGRLTLREYSWNRESSVLYMDNPVGTGFSYAKNVDCYSRNQSHVAKNAVNALEQFFDLFPELKRNEFFLAGESFAGKYIPAIGNRIHEGSSKIKNLKGIMIGNGMIDPMNASNYSRVYYELGLIDSKTRDDMAKIEKQIQMAIQNENYTEAVILRREKLLNETFAQRSGFTSTFNFLYAKGRKKPNFAAFVSKPEIRKAIHVGNATWHNDTYNVRTALLDDIMRSAVPNLIPLMDHYRSLLFYGQMDLRDPYAASINFIQNLDWSGKLTYSEASRYSFWVGDDLAGWGKTANEFTEVLLRNAGHMASYDQPKWAYHLYNSFVHEVSLNNSHCSERPIQKKNKTSGNKHKERRNKRKRSI